MGFPEGDIRVARFLGSQVRFRVEHRKLPSGYDPGRAFQRVQPGQRGLPPRSRRAAAKQPVECSVHEAARFAAPEVLRRAWITLPLTDVFSGVQVGVTATVTLGTREVVTVTRTLGPTGRTALTRLERVNLLNANPNLLGLVDDEFLQLVEMPRMDTTPVTTLSNPVQVFDFHHGMLELLCPVDEATGGGVVEVTNPALFFVTSVDGAGGTCSTTGPCVRPAAGAWRPTRSDLWGGAVRLPLAGEQRRLSPAGRRTRYRPSVRNCPVARSRVPPSRARWSSTSGRCH